MPAIQVYKSKEKGVMVPVQEAKIAKAYQCPWTGKLYASKKSYVKHLSDLRTSRMHKNARYKLMQKKKEDFWKVTTFEEMLQWVELNPDFFWQCAKNNSWSYDAAYMDSIRDDFWVKISYLDVTYSDHVSNTHSCPRNGVRNWGREPDKPIGYKGWGGRIEFQTSHEIRGFMSGLWEHLGIHTGSGGGSGGRNWGYSVGIFLDDWDGLAQSKMLDILGETRKMSKVTLGTSKYFKR